MRFRFFLPILILSALFVAGCDEMENAVIQSGWFHENKILAERYNQEHPFLDNGMEIFIGVIERKENGSFTVQPVKMLFGKSSVEKDGPIFMESLPYKNQFKNGDTVVFLAHRGMKQERNVIRAAIVSQKISSFEDMKTIEISSGINMNNGCSYIRHVYKLNGFAYRHEYAEKQGVFFELHRKNDLAQWMAKGVPHRVCIEAFTTDMDGGQKDDPPKAKCFAPELMFYQILEQYKPSRDEARDMWLKIFELWGIRAKLKPI